MSQLHVTPTLLGKIFYSEEEKFEGAERNNKYLNLAGRNKSQMKRMILNGLEPCSELCKLKFLIGCDFNKTVTCVSR